MKKIFALMLCMALCLLLCFAFAGCGGTDEPEGEEVTINLCYASANYIETGDESQGMFINSVVTYIAAEPEAVPTPLEVVEMLRSVPEELEGADTAINERYVINSVEVEESIATVDVASEGLTGGSLEETLFVGQIVETLCASFDDIEKVKFTVDGADADTLMGHMDISQPFTPENGSEQ